MSDEYSCDISIIIMNNIFFVKLQKVLLSDKIKNEVDLFIDGDASGLGTSKTSAFIG